MILMNRPTLTRGNLQMNEQNKDGNRFPNGRGVLVTVLVESIYNGPDLKALPKALVGDVISVAGGSYAVDLINSKLVEPYTFTDPDRIHDIPAGMVLTSGTEDRPLTVNADLLGQKKDPFLNPIDQPHMLYAEPDPSLDISLRTQEEVDAHLQALKEEQDRLANGETGQTILTRQPNPVVTTYGNEFGATDAPIFINDAGETQTELGIDSPLYPRPGQVGSNDPKALLTPVAPLETDETRLLGKEGGHGSKTLISPSGTIQASVDPGQARQVATGYPWDFWEGAGLSNQLAQALYEHGFTSKALLVEKVNNDGYNELLSIPGIAKKRAIALYNWALVA